MTADPSLIARLNGVVVHHADRGPIGPVDLAVTRGEIVAVVGASGCGKSTLLRLLAGLETPDAGRVERRVDKGRTGLVFQNATLMPWAAAVENVALPLRLAGQSKDQAHVRARTALAQVGLGERAGARPHQLSGGMAMRASLARALVTDPDLLLLDEPFAALDSATRRALIEDIHALWARRRPAVVFVTHDVEEAAYMAGRVLVMRAVDGRIAAEISTPGALPRPAGHRLDPAHAPRRRTDRLGAGRGLEPAA
ncbi:ABC transporter ATP-binding protein [Brevundimonas denitrificans]|uniref:ABC transporter ATP-binding protein n=1 Tax=Brevundimonas denitrificans TaxID=1443434 RepID=UPI00223BF92F|nr:ATP-binding cassette domain-containing protein [Brevundimonas denitrificans]